MKHASWVGLGMIAWIGCAADFPHGAKDRQGSAQADGDGACECAVELVEIESTAPVCESDNPSDAFPSHFLNDQMLKRLQPAPQRNAPPLYGVQRSALMLLRRAVPRILAACADERLESEMPTIGPMPTACPTALKDVLAQSKRRAGERLMPIVAQINAYLRAIVPAMEASEDQLFESAFVYCALRAKVSCTFHSASGEETRGIDPRYWDRNDLAAPASE
jgi:hypothetical protein